MKTRAVNKYLYSNYLKKSEECLQSAKESLSSCMWNSCVISCIHSAISASDAILVFFKEIRSTGESHEDVIALLRTLEFGKEEINSKTRQLHRLLQIKNKAEYEETLMKQNDAEDAVRDAERFLSWAKEKVGAK